MKSLDLKNGEVVFQDGDAYVYWCGINSKYVVQHILGDINYDNAMKFDDFEEAKECCLSDKNKPIY